MLLRARARSCISRSRSSPRRSPTNPSVICLVGFYAATMIIFTMYGGGFATIPAYLADMFGTMHVGGIHGRLLTAWSTAGVLGPLAITSLRQMSVTNAIQDLAAKVDPAAFAEKVRRPVDAIGSAGRGQDRDYRRLMEIAPAGTIDPTPSLYNTTMYSMAALSGRGVLCQPDDEARQGTPPPRRTGTASRSGRMMKSARGVRCAPRPLAFNRRCAAGKGHRHAGQARDVRRAGQGRSFRPGRRKHEYRAAHTFRRDQAARGAAWRAARASRVAVWRADTRGQERLVWSKRILGDARQLRDEMRMRHDGLSGEVRLAVIPTAQTWAARLCTTFAERHPNVRFTILSRNSREILLMLEDLGGRCRDLVFGK